MQRGRETAQEEDEAPTPGAPKERYQQQRRRRSRKQEEPEAPLKLRGNYFTSYPLRVIKPKKKIHYKLLAKLLKKTGLLPYC